MTGSCTLRFSAPLIALLRSLAETSDNYLALAIILGIDKRKLSTLDLSGVDPSILATELTLLGICALSAIPEGLVVFYHMLKKSRSTLDKHSHQHGHDHHHHHHSCPSLRKALSLAINAIGLTLRSGLTLVSVREFMGKFILPYCGRSLHPLAKLLIQWGPGIPIALGGQIIAGRYTEAEHTHAHITGQHSHSKKTQLMKAIMLLVYASTFTSHALGYFFDVKEITDATPKKPDWAQFTCYGIGLVLCAITALQDSFLEGHHVGESKEFAKTLSCSFPDVIGMIGALINIFAHAFPGFAGGVVFLRTFHVDDVYCWLIAGAFAAMDMFPSLALHGRYIIEACRDLASCMTGKSKSAIAQTTEYTEPEIMSEETSLLPIANTPSTSIN